MTTMGVMASHGPLPTSMMGMRHYASSLGETGDSASVTWRYATEKQELVSGGTFVEVIRRARHRDEEALVALYKHGLPVVYRYVMARLGRLDLVEDVVSEVFLVMVESIGDLRAEHEPGFYAWLIQIARGKISRTLRHLSRKERKHLPLPGPAAWADQDSVPEPVATDRMSNPVAAQEWRETLRELDAALASLSAEQQAVVVGRFLAGQSIEDLAQALGKQPGAVRALQFRALGALAERLGLPRGPRRRGKGGSHES